MHLACGGAHANTRSLHRLGKRLYSGRLFGLKSDSFDTFIISRRVDNFPVTQERKRREKSLHHVVQHHKLSVQTSPLRARACKGLTSLLQVLCLLQCYNTLSPIQRSPSSDPPFFFLFLLGCDPPWVTIHLGPPWIMIHLFSDNKHWLAVLLLDLVAL